MNRNTVIIPHLCAAIFALTYAWHISQTSFVQSGLQFVTPLLIILAIHTLWIAGKERMTSGFSVRVIGRSAQTTALLALSVFAISLIAPMPAQASGLGQTVEVILGVLMCLAILALVLAVFCLIIWLIVKFCRWAFGRKDQDDDTTLNDFGTLFTVSVLLGTASLEGLPNFYSFNKSASAKASQIIEADIATVWDTLETATSPAMPLPNILSSFPRPTKVVIDQGTSLGAKRQVKFEGREGEGYLTLRVIERTPTKAVFKVQSDTSPFSGWMTHKYLTYSVKQISDKTQLDVTLDFDRDLAPAWFFSPLMRGAGYFAMDVLARDVKARAEHVDG